MGKKKLIVIDPELKALIPALPKEESAALEQSILRDGCRDALVVWEGILVGGHNRYEICNRFSKPFRTVPLERIGSRDGVPVGGTNCNHYLIPTLQGAVDALAPATT